MERLPTTKTNMNAPIASGAKAVEEGERGVFKGSLFSQQRDTVPLMKSETTASKDPVGVAVPFDEPEFPDNKKNEAVPESDATPDFEPELFTPPDLKDAAWSPSGEKDMAEMLFPAEEPVSTVVVQAENSPTEKDKKEEQLVLTTAKSGKSDKKREEAAANNKDNNEATPKRVKKKRSWLSLSPGLRRLKRKEKLLEKKATTEEVSKAQDEASHNQVDEKRETGAPRVHDDEIEKAKDAALVLSSAPAKKDTKGDTIELVTVAEGIDDVKAAEQRNFTRAVSLDEDDDDNMVDMSEVSLTVKIQNTHHTVPEQLDLSQCFGEDTEAEQAIDPTGGASNAGNEKETSTVTSPSRGKNIWWKNPKLSSLSPYRKKSSKNLSDEPLSQDVKGDEVDLSAPSKEERVTGDQVAVSTTPNEDTVAVSSKEPKQPAFEKFASEVAVTSTTKVLLVEPADLDETPDSPVDEGAQVATTSANSEVTRNTRENKEATQAIKSKDGGPIVSGANASGTRDFVSGANAPATQEIVYGDNASRAQDLRVGHALLSILLFSGILMAGFFFAATASATTVLNGACGPISNGAVLGGSDQVRVAFEAPWWIPVPLKSKQIFHVLCGDRPRTKLVFEKERNELHRLVLSDLDCDNNASDVLFEKKNVISASFGKEGISLTSKRGKYESFRAPWKL